MLTLETLKKYLSKKEMKEFFKKCEFYGIDTFQDLNYFILDNYIDAYDFLINVCNGEFLTLSEEDIKDLHSCKTLIEYLNGSKGLLNIFIEHIYFNDKIIICY